MSKRYPIPAGKTLQSKAVWALRRAWLVLRVKLFFGYPFRSNEERSLGDQKLKNIGGLILKTQGLDVNSESLKTPRAFLDSVEGILNQHRVKSERPRDTTSFKIVFRALGKPAKAAPATTPVAIIDAEPHVTAPRLPLSQDTWKYVFTFLSDEDVCAFSQTNRQAHQLTAQERAPDSVRRFLRAVAYAKEPSLIRAMILEKPSRLDAEGTTQDPMGRVIRKKKALPIALGGLDPEMAREIWDLSVEKDVLERRGISFEVADKIRHQQYEDQFPVPPSVDTWTFDFTPFVTALTEATPKEVQRILDSKGASIKQPPSSPLKLALLSFWDNFPEDFIPRTGFRFPQGDYLNAEVVYDTNYGTWGGHWGSPKNMLFARFILGGFQRRADARLGQIIRANLLDVAVGRVIAPRSFDLLHRCESYLAYCRKAGSGFGYDCVWVSSPQEHSGGEGEPFHYPDILRSFFNSLSEACELTSSGVQPKHRALDL